MILLGKTYVRFPGSSSGCTLMLASRPTPGSLPCSTTDYRRPLHDPPSFLATAVLHAYYCCSFFLTHVGGFLRISQSAIVTVMLDSIKRAISKMLEAGVAGWAMATVCSMLLLAQSTYLFAFRFCTCGWRG